MNSAAHPSRKLTIAALILPYTLGVVLDDLAQPPTYGSKCHAVYLDALIEALDQKSVPPHLPTILTQFPQIFEKIIRTSRLPIVAKNPQIAKRQIQFMVQEIKMKSVQIA